MDRRFNKIKPDYVCVSGCGLGIYNATKEYKTCPECGGVMRKTKKNKGKGPKK